MSTIEDLDRLNGQLDPAPARVRFGPGKTQDMPHEWAAAMLSGWRERDPKRFGEALAKAAIEARLCT
jgi:hypothetical protein